MLALWLMVAGGLAVAAAAHSASLPADVPDLLAPGARTEWRPVHVGDVEGDANFPLLLFMHDTAREPAAVLMVLNAQTGRGTWSLESDPAVLIAVFPNAQTVSRLYYDPGFAREGRASGQYAEVANPDPDQIPDLIISIAHPQHSSPSALQSRQADADRPAHEQPAPRPQPTQ
jgi:hypothetical protein